MARKKVKGTTPIESTRHTHETRLNNPTEELRGFELEEEIQEMLYPRDPTLDPQLVWKGKDEQDREENLSVPILPIYKQEGITPEDMIKQLRHESQQEHAQEAALFSDFNGLSFQEMIEFYQHEQNWTNCMILGDNLQIMASLSEKEGLEGKVQTIYIDPPYGIRFGSNWQVSTRKRDVKDGKAEDVTRQPEQVRAFRDTWEKGIHSYLTYLRDRLTVARNLLTESGSVFVQISDENVHLVRSLLDEIFGSENFCSMITFRKTAAVSSPAARVNVLAGVSDLLVWYAKDRNVVKYRQLYLPKDVKVDNAGVYSWIDLPDGNRRRMTTAEKNGLAPLPEGARVFRVSSTTSTGYSPTLSQPIITDNATYSPGGNSHWKTTPDGMRKLSLARRLVPAGKSLGYIRYIDDFPVFPLVNFWPDTGTGSFTDEKVYVVQTGTKVVERCLLMTTDPGDLVLDPTCGSGTTAYVAEQWGRRWITIDTSRVALTLARTRLMSAKYLYYLLADSPEGIKREAEITGQVPPSPIPKAEGDIKKGFVYKRVPHVTLKSIANNPDIREGMSRKEIDAAIARYADSETLFDQPYEDKKRLRVTGPFTVESLSPHRAISEEDDQTDAEARVQESANGQFETTILENLRRAGVQNTVKEERMTFDRLEPYAGTWIHAEGDYTENDTVKSVGVSIGPQYGTVGSRLLQDAAKEAIRVFDLLVICGMAFDPHVYEEAKRYPNLTIILPRMNADLSMGDELLKKTGAGNLFTVFGEPDIEIRTPNGNGKLEVEIKGLDIYDPTTGQIRSNTTDDIACWFIDTNYSGNSFIVRHAYFTGADKPYEKLRRTTKVFDRPRSEWIAVPVPESGIPREWVDAAREAIKDNQRQSANGDRFWELSGGVLYCAECGCRMTVHATLDSRNGRRYCYYRCPKRGLHGLQKVCINGKHHRAAEAEAAVWDLISRLLKHPERLRRGLDEMIEQERAGMRGDPDQEAASWLERLSEVEQERRGYLRFAAKGHMTDDELDEALAELEETRVMAEEELVTIRGRKEIVEELERDRDALLESYAKMTPEALDALTPEERRQVYGMLRLKVEVDAEGRMEARGILSESIRVLYENGRPVSEEGFCENGLASLFTICSDCTESGKPRRA